MSSLKDVGSNNAKTIKLRNGVEIPILGYGTSRFKHSEVSDELCGECIKYALTVGYRLIDTAEGYKNEYLIKNAIEETKLNRNDIFIITKLFPTNLGYENALSTFERSCKLLSTTYLDCYLIHFPGLSDSQYFCKKQTLEEARELRLQTWRAFEELYKQGKCRTIGVSNFMPRHIQEIIDANMTIPFINQCEFSPYCRYEEIMDFCAKHEILYQGFSPFGKGIILSDPVIQSLAEKYNKTPSQIIIQWSLQNSLPCLPCSFTLHRIKENFEGGEFRIEETDMNVIWNLNKNLKATWDPTDVI